MKKTAEWYEIDKLIPNGTWHMHADEWWLESPDSIFTLRWSRVGDRVDWWMYRKNSVWMSGQFFVSDDSSLDYDTQAFDMVIHDYESKAWGLDDLVMSDPYRYSKRSVRKRADCIRRRLVATAKTALLDDDVYRQSMQIVDDVEGELDYENAYYSHDTLLSMYDIMRDAIDAFATSKFLGSDESSLSRQWQEAVDRTEDFLDATGSIFTAREVAHAYADILFAKHDRPYFRDVYGGRKGQPTCRCTRDC